MISTVKFTVIDILVAELPVVYTFLNCYMQNDFKEIKTFIIYLHIHLCIYKYY